MAWARTELTKRGPKAKPGWPGRSIPCKIQSRTSPQMGEVLVGGIWPELAADPSPRTSLTDPTGRANLAEPRPWASLAGPAGLTWLNRGLGLA